MIDCTAIAKGKLGAVGIPDDEVTFLEACRCWNDRSRMVVIGNLEFSSPPKVMNVCNLDPWSMSQVVAAASIHGARYSAVCKSHGRGGPNASFGSGGAVTSCHQREPESLCGDRFLMMYSIWASTWWYAAFPPWATGRSIKRSILLSPVSKLSSNQREMPYSLLGPREDCVEVSKCPDKFRQNTSGKY